MATHSSTDYPESESQNLVDPIKTPGMFDPAYLIPRLIARWHWILIGLLLGVLAGIVNIQLSTPMYRSTASMLVKSQVDGESISGAVDLQQKEAIETIRFRLNSPDLFELVATSDKIRQLPKLVPPPKRGFSSLVKLPNQNETTHLDEAPPVEKLAGMIDGWTYTEARRNTRYIDLTVQHPNPETAEVIANVVVESFIERQKDKKRGETETVLSNNRADLARVADDLQSLTTSKSSYNELVQAESQLDDAEALLEKTKTRYLFKHPRFNEATALEVSAREKFLSNLQTLAESHREADNWKEYREQITKAAEAISAESELRENYRKAFPSSTDQTSLWENLAREVKALRDSGSLRNLRFHLASTVSNLTSKIDNAKTQYETLLTATSATPEGSETQPEVEVEFSDRARAAALPFAPDRKSILVKNTVLGLLGGLAIAFAFQFFDNKFHGVAELEQAFGVPVISAIQKLPPLEQLQEEMLTLSHLPPALHNIHPTLAIPGFQIDCVHSEMFRVLRASFSLLGDPQQRKTTLVSSSLPGEGKTFVAANLAVAYAKQGTRTLIVDFDLRKPALHKIFNEGRADRPGIVNVLNGSASANQALVQYEGFENLHMIFSGPATPNPGELLEPHRVRSLLKMFAANYDHVIIDSAPLLPVPDTRIIAPMVSNFGLVARADHTALKAVQSTLALLADDNLRPSGLILNAFTEDKLQGGKYGYGYGYGNYREDSESS